MPSRSLLAGATAAALLCWPALSPAQVTLKPDGQWRYLLSAGANFSTGNNDSGSLNLQAEGARQRSFDKWTWDAKADRARSGGNDTVERYALRSQYNRDFSVDGFGFGYGEALRDRLANISGRYSLATGLGRHVWRDDDGFFDVLGGVAYTYDRYINPTEVAGGMRESYGRLELLLSEESSHKLSTTTSLRQKLSLFPDLRDSGKFRAVFDLGLTVAMTPRLNLTAGVNYRYDSEPGTNLKKADAMFVTGVSMRFD
jgi:putative salt-induced outer membrane protein